MHACSRARVYEINFQVLSHFYIILQYTCILIWKSWLVTLFWQQITRKLVVQLQGFMSRIKKRSNIYYQLDVFDLLWYGIEPWSPWHEPGALTTQRQNLFVLVKQQIMLQSQFLYQTLLNARPYTFLFDNNYIFTTFYFYDPTNANFETPAVTISTGLLACHRRIHIISPHTSCPLTLH